MSDVAQPERYSTKQVVKMSNQTIEDVTLDLDDVIVEGEAVGDSSTPVQEIVPTQEVEKQEEEAVASNESDDESETNASPVEDSHTKPGDMIPRARLNQEILKKKKNAEELQRAREEQETLRKENEELRNSSKSAPVETPYPSEADPGIDYDSEKLRIAQTKWQAEEVSRQIAKSENARKTEAQQKASQNKAKEFDQKLVAYANENPEYVDDFKEAGDPTWPRHINDAVSESDVGPALDHYLLKNAAERERILGMPPLKALMAIGVIENSIANPDSVKKAKPRLTGAPPPIEQSSGGVAGRPMAILDGFDIE
jgi:hypothetical protein